MATFDLYRNLSSLSQTLGLYEAGELNTVRWAAHVLVIIQSVSIVQLLHHSFHLLRIGFILKQEL